MKTESNRDHAGPSVGLDTAFFVTVGTSAIGNSARRCGIGDSYLERASWFLEQMELNDPWETFIEPLDGSRRIEGEHPKLTAELSSLYAGGAPVPERGDLIVLLTSDSEDGKAAGRFVAQVLASWHDGTVTDRTDDRDLGDTTIQVVTAKGLKVDDIRGFSSAASDIGRYLAQTYLKVRKGGNLILHPTGGFKATIPILTNLASHLPRTRSAQMWSNHEWTEDGIRLAVQPSPLTPGHRWDLRDTDEGRRTPRTDWVDYAWDATGALTPMGLALSALGDVIPSGEA